MKIVVLGNDNAYRELTDGQQAIDWVRVDQINAFKEHTDAAAFFNLNEDANLQDYHSLVSPVFINNVIEPMGEVKNIIRINGWNGFLKNESWEIAGLVNEKIEAVLQTLHKKIILVSDEPGFISARIIAMIINEAYFAKEEDVSTEEEIDIAMKLGTNYPLGPFEWAKKIGLKNIHLLLLMLSHQNKKYTPAPLIEKIVNLK